MDMWAIKHKPSGSLLPAPRGRGGRGGTHVEVGDAGQPRLFASEVAARNALRWWLSGRVVVGQSEPWDMDFDGVHEDWRTESCPHRKAEDMAVVRVALAEIE